MKVDTPDSDKKERQDRDGGPPETIQRPTTLKKDYLTNL